MTNLEWARFYINEKKWSVIPIIVGAKLPALEKDEIFQYRERYATEEELKRWFSNPKSNVGIVTGKLSNLLVVDLDKSKDHYQEDIAVEYFGDNINTPITITPSGGNHLYYQYPGNNITIGSNILPAIDYRGEGGYIVAPPSINGHGNSYSWLQDCKNFAANTLPIVFINKLINKSTNKVYGEKKKTCDDSVTSVTECDIWKHGSRDENLFTVSNALTIMKFDAWYISQVLRAIVASWGEHDDEWIEAKVKSAMERKERHERNIQAEVDAFISVTTGDFLKTNMDKELNFVTKRDKDASRQAINRRKDVTIEKAGTRDGWWRRIDTEIPFIDFNEEEGKDHPLLLPFELHNLVRVCEGNIILVSGEFNAGKTTFSLNTLIQNKNRMRIRYISSEMKAGEIKQRFKMFGIPREAWWPDANTQYVALNNNLSGLIVPDGLNIVDYIEFPEGDYTKGAEFMKRIHDKLTTGVAVVFNQQKEGARLPRSGDLILEKPRLAITLRKVPVESEEIIGIAEIVKAKNILIGKMDGKKLKYEIKRNGSQFKTIINWGWWR